MKTKKLLSMFLSLGMACATFIGCSVEEKKEENKQKTESIKGYLQQKEERIDSVLSQPLTLIGKRIRNRTDLYHGLDSSDAILYFDMDGNTNTTEVVAMKRISCPTADARVFDAKVRDKKKISEWRKQLSHKNEDVCPSKHSSYGKHYFIWERVKE